MAEPDLSIVIPVYNEEENLPELLQRLKDSLAAIGRPYEIIFVNDGSKDRSLQILKDASASDPCLKIVDFNRNYGQHAAVFGVFEIHRVSLTVPGSSWR